MSAHRELVDHVRQALIRADSDRSGTPDYDVLAEAAVIAVMERLALQSLQRLKRDLSQPFPEEFMP